MKKIISHEPYSAILTNTRLFHGIPEDEFDAVLELLDAEIYQFDKGEYIQQLAEPLLYSGIVLSGTVEGSFISEAFNKININYFTKGHSFGEALACVETTHSPIQLKALTDCTVLRLNLKNILGTEECACTFRSHLSTNLIKILATQNVFSNLKLRIANQKSLRDRILMYFYSLPPDETGFIHLPFNKTALAEFLGVNRSALSREFSRMKKDGIIEADGKNVKLLR